jgi:hypothetical protein
MLNDKRVLQENGPNIRSHGLYLVLVHGPFFTLGRKTTGTGTVPYLVPGTPYRYQVECRLFVEGVMDVAVSLMKVASERTEHGQRLDSLKNS